VQPDDELHGARRQNSLSVGVGRKADVVGHPASMLKNVRLVDLNISNGCGQCQEVRNF